VSEATFDYVIIGAGTAGALMANRLSADRNRRVLLIEAGPRDDYHWIHIPVGYLYCIGNPRTDWMYSTEPDTGLNGRVLRYPRGKTVGGCSSINGMIYMRGQSRDYDRWAELTGDETWSWAEVLPAFKQHEDHYLGGGTDPKFADFHTSGGEWRVDKQRLRWDILDAFAEAATQAGIPRSSDFNRGSNEGVGYFEVNQKNGWRWNTAKAFLRSTCYGRPNFEMRTGAQVARLNITGLADGRRRCTGAEVWDGGEMMTVQAARAVILCAGSIGSPQILQLSGVGPANLLRNLGIDLVADAPGVGANLQDHLRQGQDQPRVPAQADRPDEHGAVAARRFHSKFDGACLAESRIPRAAAVVGRIRRAAARFSRFHGQRVQPESDQPRHGVHQDREIRRCAGHRAQLSKYRRRSQSGGRLVAGHAPHRRAAGAREVPPRGVETRRRAPER